jgi:hypothetical protein
MMQRSDLFLAALGAVGVPAGYLVWDVPGAAVVATALGVGVLAGLASRPRRAPARQRPRHAPLAQGAVRLEPTARAKVHTSFVPVQMETAAALARPGPAEARLRMTGDILRGMQTGKTQRGVCSQCNATIWLSARRPVKARCPVCGFSRVLS